jgi:hypothetical protein
MQREMTRQEVWAIYERGAKRRQHEFVVLTIEPEAPLPYIGSMATERMPAPQLDQFDFFEP